MGENDRCISIMYCCEGLGIPGIVDALDWLDLPALHCIEDELRALMQGSLFIDETRQDTLCNALQQRIEMLDQFIHSKSRSSQAWIDDQSSDVQENIAYSGTSSEDD